VSGPAGKQTKQGMAGSFKKPSLCGFNRDLGISRRSFVNILSLFGMGILALGAGTSCNRPLPKPGRIPKKNSRKGLLFEKAVFFNQEIEKWHITPEGLLAYEILWPPPKGEMVPTSFADMAIWTGCYLGAESFRYAVTGKLDAKKRVDQCVEGLGLIQKVTGVPGLIARSVRRRIQYPNHDRTPEGAYPHLPSINETWRVGNGPFSDYEWLGDVSSDQLDGVVFGEAIAFDLSPEKETRDKIKWQITQIADHLLYNDMRIVDSTGKGTRHGDFTLGLLSEPLNSLIALSLLKTAGRVSGDKTYLNSYQNLVREGYAHQTVGARDPWWEFFAGINHSDNNLAFLAYFTLLLYEENPKLLSLYQKSLNRAWKVVRGEGNPFFTWIYHALIGEGQNDHLAIEDALENLRRFPKDRVDWPVRNSDRKNICKAWFSDRKSKPQACFPLPLDERPTSSFEWRENPYRLDGPGGGGVRFSGVDYLLAYWMGRYYGFVGEEE